MQSIPYRIIFHIDMNCFFASCAIAENKDLANRPIIVAHDDVFRKSIILTANYEARKYGIYTTMMVKDAMRLCPNVVIVEPNFELYQHYSTLFFQYLYTITNKIEKTSIDEAYMDATEICQKINAITLANKIQTELNEKHQLPVSIGIAPNKFLAKMASDMKKPLGITILRKREVADKLWPLSIGAMHGVGKKTKPKLESIGIATIGDAAQFKSLELLRKTVGPSMAEYIYTRANGQDDSPVDYYSVDDVSSVSNSHTFHYNVLSIKHIKDTLKVLTNSVCERLAKKNLSAYTIGIQLKYGNFKFINRSKGLENPIQDCREVWEIVDELFEDFYEDGNEVRLVGVFATRLTESKAKLQQVSIFDDFDKLDKQQQIDELLKQIKNEYGKNSIQVGYYSYPQKGNNNETR